MMKKVKILVLSSAILGAIYGFSFFKVSTPEKDKLLLEIITYVLERGHYDSKNIDDVFSENVFMNYIKGLDGSKRCFIKGDIDNLNLYKTELDNQIRESKLDFFDYSYRKYTQRLSQIETFYKPLLERPFDFSKQEKINFDYDKMDYAESLSELRDRWFKHFKFSTLEIYTDKKKEELNKFEKDSTYQMISDVELEKQARTITKENMDAFFEIRNDLQRKDYFSLYLNSITSQFDPHTYYFAPQEKERFDQSMSGKFEGIGARLQKTNQQVKVVEIISGGPVWRGKLLEIGDIILKVAQENEDPVDVSGMRLDDVVKLIKGHKGTNVYLTVKHVDYTIEVIPVTRDIVELEEAFAKSTIILKEGKKYGLIHLPKFYVDTNDYGQRNAATDVKKEIEKLKNENVEGIILDLRNNGGGSLQTVVDMTGYFIKDGPIVQVKSAGGGKKIFVDRDPNIYWDGSLVIMINEFSASASEIIAAALQDYKRAILIGNKQTFGKGTVQNIMNLNQIVSNNTHGDLGAMKVTTDKFYRINGESTQLEGVESDIILPGRYTYVDTGERSQNNPLSWDKISATPFELWSDNSNFDYAIEQSKKRISNNSYLKLINEHALWIKDQQDNSNSYSLNYDEFIAQRKIITNETAKYDELDKFKSDFTLQTLKVDLPALEESADLKERRVRWEESLTKDIYLYEAVNVLQDLRKPLKTLKLASRNEQ